jgi:putative phosphoserine phosphatase/1-acylglycerol-3-phosphate O-acyltransferase
MQAGVPIVPIVIHNSGDVAPKGDFVFRPATVEVEVLPPVDTSRWRVETIDEHVREVRNMFARVLGQPEERTLMSKPVAASNAEQEKGAGKRKHKKKKEKKKDKNSKAVKVRATKAAVVRKEPRRPVRPKLQAKASAKSTTKKQTR